MSTVDAQAAEKRADVRLPVNSLINIVTKPDNQTLSGKCFNMSASGILINTDTEIDIDTELSLSLAEGKINFSADGKVVRLVEADGGQGFLVAIKMSNINAT